MKKILFTLLYFPIISIGQTHSIDQHILHMYGNSNDPDISINTYYNSIDTNNISWNIIYNSLPSQWEFSICFPNCYPIGIVNSQNLIYPNEQTYLNCHMYPNGQAGTGMIKMEIITDNIYKDTVTWIGNINNLSSIEIDDIRNRKIIHKLDIFGRKTKQTNQPVFYIYKDGTVQKRIIIK